METPFVFGKLATKANFTDRVNETRHLVENFQSLINTIIISPRRWGKSSLVHKASAVAMQKDPSLRICHIDLFNVRDEAHFYTLLVDAIIRATTTKVEEAINIAAAFMRKIIPNLVVSTDPSIDYTLQLDWERTRQNTEEVLDLAEKIAAEKNIKLVICIDEFQNIASFSDSTYLQKRLRAHWQRHEHVAYCFYGSKRHMMLEVFADSSMPFYKFGDLIFLQKIPADDLKKFICDRFEQTGKKITEDAASKIVALTDCHPYYTQQLAQLSWLRATELCDVKIAETAHRSLVEQLSLLFVNITETLTNSQLNYLHAVIDDARAITSANMLKKYELTSATAATRAKKALIEKGIIDEISGETSIQDPIYAYWLRHTYFR